VDEPFSSEEARRRIKVALAHGSWSFSTHASKRAAERGMDLADCLNVLRSGKVDSTYTTFELQTWRYRVCTPRMWVVVAFAEQQLVIVTACRSNP
jgi:hypothetical protein